MAAGTTVERECRDCGSAVAAGQEYCLECGSRLPADRRAAGLPSRRLATGGPGVMLLATGAVAVAAAAVVYGVRLTRGEAEPVLVATAPQLALPTTTQAEPVAEALPPTEPAATGTTPAPAARRPAGRLIEWPEGRSGWTVVVASLPAGPGSREQARRQARRAARSGLPRVGVLQSSRFSSLHPGYLVVFSGVYPNRSAADQALSRARAAGFEAGYTREVVR